MIFKTFPADYFLHIARVPDPRNIASKNFLKEIYLDTDIVTLSRDTKTKTNTSDCRMMGKLIELKIVIVTVIVIS